MGRAGLAMRTMAARGAVTITAVTATAAVLLTGAGPARRTCPRVAARGRPRLPAPDRGPARSRPQARVPGRRYWLAGCSSA